MSIVSMLSGLLDRIFVIAGAFLGSQVPSFMHQYTQRLAGRVDELQFQIKKWQELALLSNRTLPEYIQKFISSPDADFSGQGVLMQSTLERLDSLSQALHRLQDSAPLGRAYHFVAQMNGDLFWSTFHSYIPQMTMTIEGLSYSLVGMFFGYFVFRVFAKGIRAGGSIILGRRCV